ncbi:MAG: helicase-associated domain-containing protein [Nocardioidaceae bacterium]|nr:helicase-associated domain-containing protein [Nocardioidaceae bacterium]
MDDWISSLDAEELAVVLGNRPDALQGVEPRGPVELAHRLAGPHAIVLALQPAPTPVFELLEALVALGVPHRGALVELLDDSHGTDHPEQVDRVLHWLRTRAIVWPDPSTEGAADTLAYPVALHDLMPAPLGLGTPARLLLEPISAANLNTMLTQLGLPRRSTKRATLDAVVTALADGDRIRTLVASAPPEVAAELTRLAVEQSADDGDGYLYAGQAAWERRRQASQWAGDRALLVRAAWGGHAEMPAEVALALRGLDYRAPFHPVAPRSHRQPVDPVLVERVARGALAGFVDRCASVLDLVARTPVKALKSGGLGARELGRITKQTGCSEPELRLVLELAGAASLLTHGPQVAVSDDFTAWRAEEPAARFAQLLWAWWELPATPTETRDEDGKPRPALRHAGGCPSCLEARKGLLTAATDMAAGESTEPRELVDTLLWARPLVHLVAGPGAPAVWREAEQLGVLAHGSATDLGRALALGDTATVRRLAVDLLPAATEAATFGSDLTAVVAGPPSAKVSATLDAAADRESRGPATVWRFSTGSVRRALDEGAEPDGLLAGLEAVATGRLPQPLRYLVADVGRRHGSIRVREAVCVLVANDEPLAAQLAADRSLRTLRLRVVERTVLLASADAATTTAGLRKAGYLPVREDDAGVRVVEGARQQAAAVATRRVAHRAVTSRPSAAGPVPTRPTAPEPADITAAAARILAGESRDDVATSRTELLVARHTRRLATPDVRLLAHAIDTDGAVSIEYVASSGGHTVRTISEIELIGGQLSAWCHLRTDDRQFALDRIRSVSPVVTA